MTLVLQRPQPTPCREFYVFVVATAPMSIDGHVNCSPKGLDSPISDSCGFGVPLMEFQEDRAQLRLWAERKGLR